jgi:hypothetical protein
MRSQSGCARRLDSCSHAADDHGWGYDDVHAMGEAAKLGDTVAIDPHIVCTPSIADLDADGAMELIVAVSYFFDRAYYDNAEHRQELPRELDLSMYVASGVVVFDLNTHGIKWSRHLDLSTDHVSYRCALRCCLQP